MIASARNTISNISLRIATSIGSACVLLLPVLLFLVCAFLFLDVLLLEVVVFFFAEERFPPCPDAINYAS